MSSMNRSAPADIQVKTTIAFLRFLGNDLLNHSAITVSQQGKTRPFFSVPIQRIRALSRCSRCCLIVSLTSPITEATGAGYISDLLQTAIVLSCWEASVPNIRTMRHETEHSPVTQKRSATCGPVAGLSQWTHYVETHLELLTVPSALVCIGERLQRPARVHLISETTLLRMPFRRFFRRRPQFDNAVDRLR